MNENHGAVTFKGNPLTLAGTEIKVGDRLPDAEVLDNGLAPVKLSTFRGKRLILLTVPSLDTPVCDLEVKRFNQEATNLGSDVVIAVTSMDLPFAQARWCGAGGISGVKTYSDHREGALGYALGVMIKELKLHARTIFVVDREGVVRYRQLVKEVADAPNYDEVLKAVGTL